ncbi:Multiple organellar RNA editing factor 8 [Hibiscus syriacus]|uniref:Multiple organellar RNA editing factor 8 n=1 Tax=Hibiscus syriacus TaxID=106335 RepID=A0A6A2YW87_HIBSY|nr:multiple organellar RNA editing factor 8, chloroplastic/mitochondrial-like isoform X1 [Hibiscus syriacus]XP_039022880.1 multiple organellar RNA editing factor 8, chloroplastic/mitochondrial-like isoform X1 [Hibiscus syriacus]KAE8683764.1 Multiple organellar RNA editing factor 8 [Hibiscus syriacus]
MATQTLSRALLSNSKSLTSFLFPYSRSFYSFSSSAAAASSTKTLIAPSPPPSLSFLRRLRAPPCYSPLVRNPVSPSVKSFSTKAARSSLNDPNPNYSNRPPKETILLDGCDFEHWLVVMEPPKEDATRDDIIDFYIKTLAQVVGSEDEARMKIYSVSTRHYYAFGALVSEELSYKIKEIPGVRWVLPDSYLDVKNKDYGGEPFINGQAVPYDPKYHEEWVRNNARANERNRRNDRPRNYDRSRNYERRRENMQPNRDMPPSQGIQNTAGMPPNNMGGMPPPNNNMGGMPPPNNMGGMPPPNNMGGMPPPNNNMGGMPPPNNMRGMPPPNNMGGMSPPNNMGGMSPPNMGNMPSNQGWSSNNQNFQKNPNYGNAQNFQNVPNYGSPYQGGTPNAQYQNDYAPNDGGENMSGGGNYKS